MSATTSETSIEGIVDPAFAIRKLDIQDSDNRRYIAGYANVAGVRDSQGDVVTLEALQKAWEKWRQNPDYCILSFLHSNIPLAKVVFESVTDSEGKIHQSGVDETGLYLVSQIRDDTTIAAEMWNKIEQKEYRGYSIAGKNLNPQPRICEHGTCTTNIVDFELYEVAIVDNPANKFSLFNVLKRDDLAKLSEVTNPIRNTVLRNGLVKISKKPCPEGGHYHVVINAKGELYNELSPLFEKEGMVIIEEERAAEEYVNLFNLALLRPYMGLTAEEQHGGFNSPPLQDKPTKMGETLLEKKDDVKVEKKEESSEDDPKTSKTLEVDEKKEKATEQTVIETLAAEVAELRNLAGEITLLKQLIENLNSTKADKSTSPAQPAVEDTKPEKAVKPDDVEKPTETAPVKEKPETKPKPEVAEVKPEATIETRGVGVQEKPAVGLDLGSIHENVSWKDIENLRPNIV